MKTFRKITALVLSLLLLLGASPALTAVAAEALANAADEGANIEEKTLFSSSFESDDPAVYESKSDGRHYQNLARYELSGVLAGEFTASVLLSSVEGSPDFKAEEGKTMLFDRSSSTKFLTDMRPSATAPVTVSFSLREPAVLGLYSITSANDEDGRDPKSWTLYGSADGVTYQELDKRSGERFSSRGLSKSYAVENTTAYLYYKLEITENNGGGMTQLADLRLATGIGSEESVGDSPMESVVGTGPDSSWAGTGAFTGEGALSVYAEQTSKEESYARNLLFDGLSIPVTKITKLSYVHFPSIASGYDYEYTAMYLTIDLKFSDGTYLSALSALDQNGFGMDPVAKGSSKSLYSNQWNYIESNIGDVAEGKVIESIYVYYRKSETTELHRFLAYFDDLVIENRADVEEEHLSDYINTLRGTNNTTSFSRGLTTPFCTMPNGFNFFTPVTNSGSNTHYNYFSNEIKHFSVSHIPSTWTGDYGTWQFMANTSVDSDDLSGISSADIRTESLGATFCHDNETAKAHYYSVTFDEGSRASGVTVEITPTVHGVYVRFTFPEDAENVNVIFDCVRADGSLSLAADGSFTAKSNHTDRGSGALQVAGSFDQTPSSVKVLGKQGIAVFPKGTTEVTMKFATSFLSQNQAKHNLELEITESDSFDTIFEKAQKAWDDICSMIEVEGASRTQLVTLYSCLYRMYSYPNLYSENEGTNEEPVWVYASPYKNGRKTSGKLYVNNGFWDTYRTAWAAYALLTPTLDGELLDGLIQHYKDNGWIPRWVAPGGTNSMLGTSSDIIFADAYVKGIEFDYESAFESMLKNAATVSGDVTNGGRAENNTAIFKGYVSNATAYGLSWTLEDYISDHCIGVMASRLGYADEAEYYFNRARFYVNMFNAGSRFFIGKNAEGSWTNTNYDGVGWWGDYSETNGWTMAFAPVYDGNGLANLYGGKEALFDKLESYFDDSLAAMKKVATGTIHEMVEAREVRMGQYSHSNQPAHAIPYLYVYTGAPYRTQEVVREVLSRLYVGSEIGQGYCGDEDNGEMSAWYVLSAMGFYPQNMGSGEYIIGSPLFEKMTVHLENGKDLTIVAKNNSSENIYIQSMTLNGKAHDQAFLTHDDIKNGGEIVFVMGSEPSDWGAESTPTSLTAGSEKADPAEDLVTSRIPIRTEAFSPDKTTNAVYADGIDEAAKLFDDDSNTSATLKNGDSVVYTSRKASRLLLYTVTAATRSRAPSSLKLEASADNGETWVVLDERSELSYDWNKYTRAFAIPDDVFGNYTAYRLTFGGGNSIQVAEVEFLALSADGEAGESSTKPSLPGESGTPGTDTPEPPDTSAPDTSATPGTPETPDSTKGDEDGKDNSSLGLIIGIAAAVIVGGGGAAAFAIVYRKKKENP